MRRASDSGNSRASDSAAPSGWASDSERGLAWAPDSDSRREAAPDSRAAWGPRAWAASEHHQMLGSNQMLGLGAAADLFCAAKDAEGLSPRTIAWYAMILERLIGRF